MSDAVLREAARLLRGGAPVEVFVGALDKATQRVLWLRCAAAVEAAIDARQAVACFKCGVRPGVDGVGGVSKPCCCLACHIPSEEGTGRNSVRCLDCPHREPE